MKVDPYLSTLRSHMKWIKNFNVGLETREVLGENLKQYFKK